MVKAKTFQFFLIRNELAKKPKEMRGSYSEYTWVDEEYLRPDMLQNQLKITIRSWMRTNAQVDLPIGQGSVGALPNLVAEDL
jgi:hypothetical protein